MNSLDLFLQCCHLTFIHLYIVCLGDSVAFLFYYFLSFTNLKNQCSYGYFLVFNEDRVNQDDEMFITEHLVTEYGVARVAHTGSINSLSTLFFIDSYH